MIPADNEKCVELLIIDNIWIEFCDLALKLFVDRCNEQCFECEQCIFANKHNKKILECYDILDISQCCNMCERVMCKCSMEECDLKNCGKTWKIMSEWNANCWSRSLLWWSISRGCNDASTSRSSKNFVVPSVRTSPLDTDPRWRGSRDSQVQSRNWSDFRAYWW